MNTKELQKFWSGRYKDQNTGWDIGSGSTPLLSYFDQLTDHDLAILIPGAGNAYEAEYLHDNNFKNVTVLDISPSPLENFKKRVPSFPEAKLICENFFEHKGKYDLIIEQTFFCSFDPTQENRAQYAKKMFDLLDDNGKLVGLWFSLPLTKESNRPYGGTKIEYLGYLEPYFKVHVFEDCYNSIKPRNGTELFGIFEKKMLG